MDFLVYHQLQDPATIHCIVENLEKDFEDVFACGDLITIKSGSQNTIPEKVIQSIKSCVQTTVLQKEDIIYIFFVSEDGRMKLWPLKRKGRSKMHRLEADFPYYQI